MRAVSYFIVCSLGVIPLVLASPVFAGEPNAAHAIAEKFAAASSASSVADAAQQRAANNEDAARKKAIAAKKRAEAARAAAKKREQEAALQRKVDEIEMLQRAKSEAADREAEQKRADEELAVAEAIAAAARADAERVKADLVAQEQFERAERDKADEAEAVRRVTENRRRETEAAEAADKTENERRAAMVAQRESETLRLAERLKEARRAKAAELERDEAEQKEKVTSDLRAKAIAEQRAKVAEEQNERDITQRREKAIAEQRIRESAEQAKVVPVPAAVSVASSAPATAITAAGIGSKRATVLLVLDPGDYGIRRFNHAQADPILCVGETCYVSQGPDVPAKSMPRMLALGAGNTLGGRAGACRLQLTCVFRDVDLGSGKAEIQPVDLHVLRHDRREVTMAAADLTCMARDARLVCGEPLKAKTYRAWVVPEQVATLAGGGALTALLGSNAEGRRAEAK